MRGPRVTAERAIIVYGIVVGAAFLLGLYHWIVERGAVR